MLTHIHIRHFVIIDALDLEIYPGMTVITGETGAGKSIMVDALALCMGERADPQWIRAGKERAEIAITFDLTHLHSVRAWLSEQDLNHSEECVIRRTLLKDGRSRAYINDQSVSLSSLKAFSQQLMDIHSQHAHHALLKPHTHRKLLDLFSSHTDICEKTSTAFYAWKNLEKEKIKLESNSAIREDAVALLEFQLEELDALQLKVGEWDTLNEAFNRLSRSDELQAAFSEMHIKLSDEKNTGILKTLQSIIAKCDTLAAFQSELAQISQMLNEACINCQEAAQTLEYLNAKIESDPQRMTQLENRMTRLHELSRKHRCAPNELLDKLNQIHQELLTLREQSLQLEQMEVLLSEAYQVYSQHATQLSLARQKAAPELSRQVTEQMRKLGMPDATFSILIEPAQAHAEGIDQVTFMVQFNPGSPPAPLHKIASGGELSRISLALQVLVVQEDALPIIVFDEVDVGIGGGTAAVVGELLHCLGKKAQIICVTHLPQVAACGDHHFYIAKQHEEEQTVTRITTLTGQSRVDEIARMLGGLKITEKTRQHAAEMLNLHKLQEYSHEK